MPGRTGPLGRSVLIVIFLFGCDARPGGRSPLRGLDLEHQVSPFPDEKEIKRSRLEIRTVLRVVGTLGHGVGVLDPWRALAFRRK